MEIYYDFKRCSSLLANISAEFTKSLLSGSGSVGGEESGSVSVRVVVDDLNGLVQVLGLHGDKHWAKDLLLKYVNHQYFSKKILNTQTFNQPCSTSCVA